MLTSGRIEVNHDLAAFFHEELCGARKTLGVKLPEAHCAYLVQLLCDFSRQDAPVAARRSQPLALMYAKAQALPAADRLPVLKEMGDVALYTSGFFTDSIERELVDIDYYIAMGGSAYLSLSALLGSQTRGRKMAGMYAQMAADFTALVDVLSHIAAKSQAKSPLDTDLLRLYDRWTRTGSERIRKQLRARGLLPTPDLPLTFDQ